MKNLLVRKYFSFKDQKYYDTKDKNFKWPNIAHGTYNSNKKFYAVVLERCKEDTISLVLGEGFHCSNEEEMDEAISHHGVVHFNFIDNYVDVLNYKNPITKYFYRVENSLEKENYSINHLNINPSSIKTNKGLIRDKINIEISYTFERNDAFNYIKRSNDALYMDYYLWLNNRQFYYERIYKRIQDVISNIGGIFNLYR